MYIYAIHMWFNSQNVNNVIYLLSVKVLEEERHVSVKLVRELNIDAMLQVTKSAGPTPKIADIYEHVRKYAIMESNKAVIDDSMKILNVHDRNKGLFTSRLAASIKKFRCNYEFDSILILSNIVSINWFLFVFFFLVIQIPSLKRQIKKLEKRDGK